MALFPRSMQRSDSGSYPGVHAERVDAMPALDPQAEVALINMVARKRTHKPDQSECALPTAF
jgi:hypothetical protein